MQTLSDELLRCVYRADVPALERLVASGISISAVDRDGRTALMHAVLATPPSLEVVSAMLRLGADVNVKDKVQAWAVLAFAARDCPESICRVILDAGAEVDATDAFGNTALWRATMAKRPEIMSLLLSHGANPDLQNHHGISPRMLSGSSPVSLVDDRAG